MVIDHASPTWLDISLYFEYNIVIKASALKIFNNQTNIVVGISNQALTNYEGHFLVS
jgi:hypothetical protein